MAARAKGQGRAVALALAVVLAPRAARAAGRDDRASGRDMLRRLPTIAIVDGAWSIALRAGTFAVGRTWDLRVPEGVVGHELMHAAYGGAWTAAIALEGLAASVASGFDFRWIGAASYRTDWMIGVDAAACPRPGAFGGCGVGLGGFGGLHVRPRGTDLWLEVSGGWLDQRVATDARRTVSESAWLLTPLAVAYELRAGERGPVALRVRGGPGAYVGMDNAHVQPRADHAGDGSPGAVLANQLVPIVSGAGPGGRVEAHLVFARRFALDGDVVLAPLFGGSSGALPASAAPASGGSGALATFRMVRLGVAYEDLEHLPMRIGVGVFAAELSTRRVDALGRRGVMLALELPLRLDGDAR